MHRGPAGPYHPGAPDVVALLDHLGIAETDLFRFQPRRSGPVRAVITVVVDRSDGAGVHPADLAVQVHGAGTWEALVLAEALVDAADRERRRRLPRVPGRLGHP